MRQLEENLDRQKRNWRRVCLTKRRTRLQALDPDQRTDSAKQLKSVLSDPQIPIGSDSIVATYFPYSSEPDVSRFTDQLVERGVSVVAPNLDFDGLSEVPPFLPLRGSRSGPIDVVILPALALDASGTRLGRGKGWYDRAMEAIESQQDQVPLLVGVCFADEFHKSGQIPFTSHDRKVDYVATPEGLYRTS